MPYCVVKGCPHTSTLHNKTNNSNISYHVFPKDPVCRDKWERIIQSNKGNNTWKASNSAVICSAHFHETEISYSDKGLRRIAKNAVPSQNISSFSDDGFDYSGSEYEPIQIGLKIATPEVPEKKKVSGIKIQLADDYPEPVNPLCLLELSHGQDDDIDLPLDLISAAQEEELKYSDSEMPCASDTPQVASLKKKLKRLQHWRKTAARRLKSLHQTIRRTEKRTAFLKEFNEKHKSCTCKYCDPNKEKQKKGGQQRKKNKVSHTNKEKSDQQSDEDDVMLCNLRK